MVIEDAVADKVITGGVVSEDAVDRLAVHAAVVPPFDPSQFQLEEDPWAGFEGEEGFAVPAVQYEPVGYDSTAVYVCAAGPHVPLVEDTDPAPKAWRSAI